MREGGRVIIIIMLVRGSGGIASIPVRADSNEIDVRAHMMMMAEAESANAHFFFAFKSGHTHALFLSLECLGFAS